MTKNPVSLNGEWLAGFLSDKPYSQTAEPACSGEFVLPVPGYWEDVPFDRGKMKINPLYTQQSYPQTGYCQDMFLPNPIGCLAYGKSFVLEEVPQNARLYIGGVQNAVSAWINGVYLGRYEGYSAPFDFIVPEGVLTLGENRITLAVSNNRLSGYMDRPISGLTSRAANECTGGIWGDVEIRSCPDGLEDIWVTVSEKCESFTIHTQGASDRQKTVSVLDGDCAVCTSCIPAGCDEVTFSSEGFSRWTPDTPSLYRVTVTTENQELSCTFGVRRLTVRGTKLYLNGEPYYFRGICEHCYQYATVHPTRDKNYYIAIIEKLKSLGFNSIRFHTWIPPYEYMQAADELGMLLEVETPNNTTAAEWKQIIRFCRRHPSVNLYSTGNELQIDWDYEKHLAICADLVHSQTDALFSPMSAMRGIEYMLTEKDPRVAEPFEHNPGRLGRVGEYSDLYNSYSLGLTSYDSSFGTREVIDRRNAVYGKPLLSHEICIHGTYIDLSLESRYENTRIGKTLFMSSVREHLADKGLLDKAPLYCENSSKWQSLLRKQCFELVRRCKSFAGYDFLGDIDTHWHTFGYCVGMMNEFYELKPGETQENVLRYNSPTVLLADLPRVNFTAGECVEIPLWVSHYGENLKNAKLTVSVSAEGKELAAQNISVGQLCRGELKEIHRLCLTIPQYTEAAQLELSAQLWEEEKITGNCWELYVFPKTEQVPYGDLRVTNGCTMDALEQDMADGKTVLILGTEPFASEKVTFQLSIAGRTTGHLATAIAEHPLMKRFPHSGFCAKQFEKMLNGGSAAILDGVPGTHNPIVDIATTYKNARREALLFEFRVGKGRLLVCTLNLDETDPGAAWLKKCLIDYAKSENFDPAVPLSAEQLRHICAANTVTEDRNCNRAVNKNDITA